jgi:hypothetical protein
MGWSGGGRLKKSRPPSGMTDKKGNGIKQVLHFVQDDNSE